MSVRNTLHVLGGAALVCAALSACNEPVSSPPATRGFVPTTLSRVALPSSDRHIFLMNGRMPADFVSRVQAKGGTIVGSHDGVGLVVTSGLSDGDANVLARGTSLVERDVLARWIPTPAERHQVLAEPASSEAVHTASLLPPQSAFFLPLQWNLQRIHAPEAWTFSTGIPSVKVAILDSGLDPDHIDQRGLIDVANSTAFVPSTSGPPTWADDEGHGTYVGGIVTSNNIGTAGVVSNVTLMAVKVIGPSGSGSLGNVLLGILWASDHGANVINLSLGAIIPKGGPNAATLLSFTNRVMNYAHRQGVLLVSAAGNEGLDLQHGWSEALLPCGEDDELCTFRNFISLPCEAGVGLCVSATTSTDTKASYSNYGSSAVDVAAPGGDGPPSPATWVLGLCSSRSVVPPFSVICKDRVSYIIATGTSGAAPLVSGLGAYLDSQYGGSLSASQLITTIQQNADDLAKTGTDQFFSKGRINVLRALQSAQP
jgi:lantibiotic leader peptide-processing serine protease